MSNKNTDPQGRWRTVTVGFRMSPEESKDLNKRVELSGLSKQDYLISRALERDVVVQGNPRVYKALRNQLDLLLDELKRLKKCSDVTEEFSLLFQLVLKTSNEMREETIYENNK